MPYHIDLAKSIWRQHLKPSMTVIDATSGNGNDTLFLANIVLTPNSGWVHAIDIQEKALENTRKRIEENLPIALQKRITYHHTSHELLPEISPSLIVYNLGYLPGSDETITTETASTLKSCKQALLILEIGGLISITLYPGHPEGLKEKSLILSWLEGLSSKEFLIYHHFPLNRKESPSLIVIKKMSKIVPKI